MFSGTTNIIVILHNNYLISANTGDSRAILCSHNNLGIWNYTVLNRDHKPDLFDEVSRIKKAGGRIE